MADKPVTREEKYLAYLTGDYTGEIPKPITRKEKYLYELCLKGIGGEISPEEIKAAVNEYLEKNPVTPGATTEQAQQIEQNKTDIASLKTETSSLKEDISTKITKFYASSQGENHLADSDNGKIMDMMLYGRSEQKQYSGKNLLNTTLQTTTQNGVTCTNNGDGTYTLNGTAIAMIDIALSANFHIENGKTYRITGWVKSVTGFIYLVQGENDPKDKGDGVTFTYSDATNNSKVIHIQIPANTVLNNIIIKPMIVDASLYPDTTYDDFEPYTSGIPSPNPDYPQEIKSVVNPKVVVYGKNIAKKVTVFDKSQQYITSLCIAADLRPSTTYALSFECASGYSGYINEILFEQITFVGTGNRQSVVCKTKSVLQSSQLSAKGWIIVKNFTGNTIAPKFTNVMLERISASIAYDPYHEQTVTLPYTLNAIPVSSGGNVTIDGQQYIADYVDVERGKLVRMCKEVNALDYEWTDRYKGYISIDYGILPECVHSDNVAFAKSTHDYYTSFQDKWTDKNTVIFLISDQNIGVRIAYNSRIQSNYSNLAEFKEWLKSQADNGTPLKIVYALATPEEIDLTTEEIAAFKTLATYYPTTNISVNSEQLDGYTVFNYPTPFEDEWIKAKKDVDSLKEDIGNQNFRDVYQKVNLTFTSGGYYRQEKRFTEAYVEDAGFSYCIVPVLKGEKYICRGIDYYNARACLTWKGDGSTDNTPKEYPDVLHTTPNLGQYEFTIEKNGVMVVNSRNLNGNNILYKYHNKNVNDKFDGKTVLFTGDSICNGYGWDVNEAHSNRKIICLTNPPEKNYNNLGWSQVFAENHRGCSVYSYGVNGTRITTTNTATTDSILERIQTMNENADYVILSGHMNDVFNKVELGALSDMTVGNNSWKSATFDTNTFYGAMEQLFRDSILKWKNAKIGFIITPKNCNCMKSALYTINQDVFVNAIIECCKKWCIPYLDLYHECGLVNALPDINSMYFSADQTHPNEKAYRERLSDLVESFMNRI